MITLLADPSAFGAPEIKIEGDAYRHLFRARRVEAGTGIRVVDGRGRARWGKIARVDRTSASVTLGEPAPDNEPAFRLALVVPTCRPEAAAWLVEKGTEVGVSAIHFLNMSRAPRDFGAGTLDRLRRVAAAAVEQCHRSRLPEITGPHAWREAGALGGAGLRWFLDTENVAVPPPQGGHAGPPLQPSDENAGALLVGPEGGLAPEERTELLASGWRPVGLGERILRLETAAVVGAALLLLSPSGIQDPKLTLPQPSS